MIQQVNSILGKIGRKLKTSMNENIINKRVNPNITKEVKVDKLNSKGPQDNKIKKVVMRNILKLNLNI